MAKLALIMSFFLAAVSCQCGSVFDIRKPNKTPAMAEPFSWADITEQAVPAVVKIILYSKINPKKTGTGTGFFVSPNGIIATAAHLITAHEPDITHVQVKTFDGSIYEVRYAQVSLEHDIAFIKIDVDDVPYLSFEGEVIPRQGDPVLSIGHAIGMLEWTAADGIISYANREYVVMEDSWMQVTASLNFGCSGGPVLNSRGHVIGINKGVITKGFELYMVTPVWNIYDALKAMITMNE